MGAIPLVFGTLRPAGASRSLPGRQELILRKTARYPGENRDPLQLSTQVVQEFYAAGSRKLGMPRKELREATAALLDCPLVIVGPPEIQSAMDLEVRYQISFRDGLILAAAETGGSEVLFTEDLSDGQQYGTVRVRNPFRSSQEMEPLE